METASIKSTAFDAKLVPVKDFAEKHGITVQAVYQGIKRGKYQATKIGTFTLIKV
jgi:predicted DNA-binding protein YlxM (UPF0122 family)